MSPRAHPASPLRPPASRRATRLAAALGLLLAAGAARAAPSVHAHVAVPGAVAGTCLGPSLAWDGARALCFPISSSPSVAPADYVRWVIDVSAGAGTLGLLPVTVSDTLAAGLVPQAGTLTVPGATGSGWSALASPVAGVPTALATWAPTAAPASGAMVFNYGANELLAAPVVAIDGTIDVVLLANDPAAQRCGPAPGGDVAWLALLLPDPPLGNGGTATYYTATSADPTSVVGEAPLTGLPVQIIPPTTPLTPVSVPLPSYTAAHAFKIELKLGGMLLSAAGQPVAVEASFGDAAGAPQICFDAVLPATCPAGTTSGSPATPPAVALDLATLIGSAADGVYRVGGGFGGELACVSPPIVIAPASANAPPRGSVLFSASGGSGTGFTWSLATNASGGSVNPTTGAYLAGPTGSVTDVVQVADSLGGTATRSIAVSAGLAIAPASATAPPRGPIAFSASGGSGTGLTWSLATNASGGSVNPTTGAYLAGPAGGVADVVQVTDSLGNTATRTVTVSAGVAIAPATAIAPPRGSIAFTASGGSGTGFTWSLATNGSGGAITAAGLYTAGATGSVGDVVQVTDSLGNTATRGVTVSAGLAIAPASASVAPRGARAFTASGGSGTGLTWSLATNASGGSINPATGAYLAGPTGGVTDVVRVADSLGNVATASVTVGAGLVIAPATATAPPRGSIAFTASGGSGTGLTWSLSTNASGGSINPATGAYLAGPTGGVTDVVRVADSLGNVATASVTVGAGLAIAPATATAPPRGSIAFTASGGSGTGLTWSLSTNASGGSINPATGAYLAGPTGGVTDVVRVVDSLANLDTQTITVTAGLSIAPATATAPPRGPLAFTASGGSGTGFTWSLATNASGGSINPGTGAYLAGPTGGVTDVVQVADSLGNTATRNVAVSAGVAIAPATATAPPRGPLAFSASGGSGAGFTWSLATNASGGSINPATGAYLAGPAGGVTDVVRCTDGLGNFADRSVTVSAGLAIAPATATAPPRGALTFTASGGSGTGFTWSLATNASGGSINPATGAYLAGPTGGVTDLVRCTDSLGNTATRSVGVTAGVSITPGALGIPPRGVQVFTASGGSGTGFTWSFATNASGGTINPATGAYLAGPAGGVTDLVRCTDSLGNLATVSVSVTSALAITAPSTTTPPRGALAFTASGGSGLGFTWSLATNASGGTINPATGAYLAGPTGGVTDVVRVTDSLGNTATQSVGVTAGVGITSATGPVPPRDGRAFSASGGSGTGFTWSLAANASGGSINPATGAYLAGPTGGVTDVVRVVDSLGNVAIASVTVGAGLAIAPASVTLPPRGAAAFTASGGSGTGLTWSLATNASGGSINPATGAYLAGATGGVTDVVQVADSLGNTATRGVTVSAGVAITPASASLPPRGSQGFSASGGSGTGFTWSLATNASGGTINPASGAYLAGPVGGVTDVVQVADSLGNTATRGVTVSAGVAIAPASASLPPRGSQGFSASGGSGTGFTWSLATNASGGTIDPATGAYVAGPTGGVADVVQVADSLGNLDTQTITVTAGVSITSAIGSVPPRGSRAFAASGGSGTGFTWSLATSASGGTINPATGAYVAGPTGGVTDVVQVADSLGNTATRAVTVSAGLAIAPAIATAPPRGSIAFTASGGSGTGFTWSLASNVSEGAITAAGAYTAGPTGGVTDVVRVSDSLGNTATRAVTVSAGLAIAPTTATAPPRGALVFSASGGSGSGFVWSLATNASGGSITATGRYTAGAAGGVTDVVEVSDSLGNTATQSVGVTAGVSITPGALGIPPRGVQAFTASGGSGTGYRWSLGASPSGSRIDASSGLFTAGPTEGVDVVRVVDSLGNSATVTVTVTAHLSITASATTTPPRGQLTLSGAGGSASGYVWSFATNASGATISAAGTYLAGATPGVVDVVQLADSLGNTATLAITVGPGVAISLPAASVLASGSLTLSASGGSGTGFTWSMASAPSGGTISQAGVYVAGPTGGVTDVVRVVDSLGNEATRAVTVVARPRLVLAKAGPSSMAAGGTGDFTVTLGNRGGSTTTGALAFLDQLPAGLTFVRQAGASPMACSTTTAGLVTCTGTPAIAPGGSLAVTYTVAVALDATGALTNTALASAAGGDPRPLPSGCTAGTPGPAQGSVSDDGFCARWSSAARSGTLSVELSLARVNLQPVAADYRIAPGDLLEYAVRVAETTGEAGAAAQVTATVPELTTYAGAAQDWSGCAGPGTSCSHTFALAAGQAASVRFTVQVAALLPDGLRALTAAVTAPAPATCPGCSVTTPTVPKLALTMTSPPVLPLGGTSSYTVTVANLGGSPTTGAVGFSDLLPDGLAFAGQLAGAPALACTVTGRTVACAGAPAIPPGGTAEVTIGVSIGAHAAGPLVSTATLTQLGGDPRRPSCDAAVPTPGHVSQSADGTCAVASGEGLSGDAVQFRGSGVGCGCAQGRGGLGLDGLALGAALLLGTRRRRRTPQG